MKPIATDPMANMTYKEMLAEWDKQQRPVVSIWARVRTGGAYQEHCFPYLLALVDTVTR